MVFQIRNNSTITMVQPERRRLVAGMTPGSGWHRLLPLLELAGFILPDQEADQRSPEEWLREFPGLSLLLFHARPEAFLTDAMRNGQSPAEALAQWREAAGRLLATFRHQRSRVALVDVDTVLAEPGQFLRACHDHLGMNSGYIGSLPALEVASPADNLDEAYRLIAAQMITQAPDINALLMELEACSLPIGDPSAPPVVDCEQVYHDHKMLSSEIELAHKQLVEKDAQLADLQMRREEIPASRQQIADLTQSLEEQNRNVASLTKRIKQLDDARKTQTDLATELRNQLTQLQTTHQILETTHRESTQENDLLLQQLHQVQEELESYYLQLQSTNDKLQKAEKKQESMERMISSRDRRIRYIESSKSWKVTAPLRAIMSLFVRRPEKPASRQS